MDRFKFDRANLVEGSHAFIVHFFQENATHFNWVLADLVLTVAATDKQTVQGSSFQSILFARVDSGPQKGNFQVQTDVVGICHSHQRLVKGVPEHIIRCNIVFLPKGFLKTKVWYHLTISGISRNRGVLKLYPSKFYMYVGSRCHNSEI